MGLRTAKIQATIGQADYSARKKRELPQEGSPVSRCGLPITVILAVETTPLER